MTKVMINKNVFGIKDLNTRELRLYLLICSQQYLKDDMSTEEKEYVVGGNRKYSKEIPTYIQTLKNNNLIEYDFEVNGWVSILDKKNFVVFEELPNVKNLRQLFILSLNKWHVTYNRGKEEVVVVKNPIVSKKIFDNVFGTQLKRVNENWNRTCEQCNVEYTWKEQANTTILINLGLTVVEEEVIEEVVEVKEVKEETVEVRTENYEVVEEQCSVADLESFVDGLTDCCSSSWALVNGGVR